MNSSADTQIEKKEKDKEQVDQEKCDDLCQAVKSG